MKILDLLENFDDVGVVDAPIETPTNQAPSISVSDLNSLQLRLLKLIATGRFDIETAKETDVEIAVDLHDLGLLDDEYELSDAGNTLLTTDEDPKAGRIPAPPLTQLDYNIDTDGDPDLELH